MTGKYITVTIYSTADCSGPLSGVLTYTSGACGASQYFGFGQETVTYVAPISITPEPKVAASPSSGISSSSSFAGDEIVSLESGDMKTISEIRVGDRVLAATAGGDQVFSEVQLTSDYFSHRSTYFKQENLLHIFASFGTNYFFHEALVPQTGICT